MDVVMEPGRIASCTSISVPVGGRVLIASDLFLTATPTEASSAATGELATAIRSIEGPGAVVIAGNCFELSEATAETSPRPTAALDAHGQLAKAMAAFLQEPDRHVILLPGTRDRAICYDEHVTSSLRSLGLEVTLAVDLAVQTGNGTKLVRVEPGWRYDTRNAFSDPTDPRDTPLGHHIVTELFPALSDTKSGWLDGADRLQDPAGLPRFIASRLTYRRLGRLAWWLLIPVALVLVARLPELWLFGMPSKLHGLAKPVADVTLTLLAELIAVAVLLAVVNHRVWTGPGSALLGPPGERANDAAREAARALVSEGYAGLVTGHTLRAELGSVGRGFFANTGACGEVVEERRAAVGMPPVFVADEQVSFVEVEGGADVHARLCLSRQPRPAGSALERLVAGRRRKALELSVVASFPGSASWPQIADPTRHRRRVRRAVGALVGLVGLLDIVSALVPVEVRGKLHPYLGYIPLGASEAASALDAFAGLTLLLLAIGLRRGQRLAWLVSVATLATTSLLHLVRGGATEVLQTLAALAVLAGLVRARDSFKGRYDPISIRQGIWALIGGAVGIITFSTLALELGVTFYGRHHHVSSLSAHQALMASAEGLVGIDSVRLPDVVSDFLDPALLAVGLGLLAVALLLAFRPFVDRRLSRDGAGMPVRTGAFRPGSAGGRRAASTNGAAPRRALTEEARDFARARDVVRRSGQGTLDYFALRFDKEHFFHRDGIVAYAIRSGVCLVSPDPIGPPEERAALWTAFRRFADDHGWSVAILGAGQDWLPVYHRSGMRDLYIGDEGVVDVRSLSLAGGTKKGLRQAVNRIAKYGYTITFHDPARVEPDLADALRTVMVKSRRGGVERGFSMTLGRIFDPLDEGLLLAVARDGEGAPVAFCQFVPAPGIEGYSLDLMRRDVGEHPNGLFDFILVRTMERLKSEGYCRLGLNFAMMRAVLAGEAGDGISARLERWLLMRMSDSMQIESLWRFNAKFDPDWLPRYVVWDSAEQSLAAALAIARAESFWELPLIGRFLVPTGSGSGSGPAGGAGAHHPQ
jgi:lysylphosphatidylglycerol synthetase-like protein (DUF2156 family)